jgi:hypothetical protein
MGTLDINAKHWASIILGLAVIGIALWMIRQAPDGLSALPGAIVMVMAAMQPLFTLFTASASPTINRAAVLQHDSLYPPPLLVPDDPNRCATPRLPSRIPPPPPPKV